MCNDGTSRTQPDVAGHRGVGKQNRRDPAEREGAIMEIHEAAEFDG
jgi:hypothetical protein